MGQHRATGNEFNVVWSKLKKNRLLIDEDFAELAKLFDNTNRDHVNVIPGLGMEYSWNSGEAEELDRRGEIESVVKGKIYEAFFTWGQEPKI
jgi:hypothetical protein